MSRLNVDKITGATGTASGAPITLSGDAATLGSGVTFPSGIVTKFQKTSTTISSEQTLNDSFADITGSSITYTPQTSASFIVYECSFVMTSPGVTNPLWPLGF